MKIGEGVSRAVSVVGMPMTEVRKVEAPASYIRVRPGHKLYDVDISSGEVIEAPFMGLPLGRKVPVGWRRIDEQKGHLYFSALNLAAVDKKVRKLVARIAK